MTSLKLLLIFFFVMFITIISRLFYLIVLHPTNDSDNYLKTTTIQPERGRIYDRSGLPLAVNTTSYLLYAQPKVITDRLSFIAKVDSVLHIGEATLEAALDPSKDWIAIQRGLTKEQKQKIINLKLEGTGFEDETKRYYPEGSLAAHLIGFVGKDKDGSDIGYFGVEGFYNRDLQGLPGVMKTERDFLGRPILIGTQEKIDAENGRSLYLTIDKSVQEIVKSRLKEGLDTYGANQGCAIIADPMTMQILALSCLPDFDVEQYYKFGEETFTNPAVSKVYEPGSIFKPLMMAAAIQEKKVKPDSIYDEQGPVTIGEYTIRTWDNKYEGPITMTRILEKSSNVGMVYIGQKLGNKEVYSYINKYGFGQLTDIDLQGETPGYLRDKSSWYPIDYATVTFGQGIAVTPVQILRAFASLVNGGKLMQPYIVSQVGEDDQKITIRPKVKSQVISHTTSELIKKMLVATVENGEVKWAKPQGYSFGGKTGTAQIPIAGHYDPYKTNASFIGFAPADKPRFIGLVVLNAPKTSQYGSETAAPLFFKIAKDLLVYYNIAPQ